MSRRTVIGAALCLALLNSVVGPGAAPAGAETASGSDDMSRTTLAAVAPLDGGHTGYSDQPIVAEIRQNGLPVDPTSIIVEVVDLTDANNSPGRFAATVEGTIIRSLPVAMTAGHAYRASIEARTVDGRPIDPLSVEFSAVSVDVASADVADVVLTGVERVDVTDLAGDLVQLNIHGLRLQLGASTVRIHGVLAHGGIGYIAREIQFGGPAPSSDQYLMSRALALVNRLGFSSTSASSVLPSPSPLSAFTAYQQFSAVDLTTPETVASTNPIEVAIPQLQVDLPRSDLAAERVGDLHWLADAITPHLTTSLPICRDPSIDCDRGKSYPTPDPLPFRFSAEESEVLRAQDVEELANAGHSIAAARGAPACDPAGLGGTTGLDLADACDVAHTAVALVRAYLIWDPTVEAWGLYQPDINDAALTGGVDYARGTPLYLPSSYAEACRVIDCGVRASDDPDLSHVCPGFESQDFTRPECTQTFTLYLFVTNGGVSGQMRDYWNIQTHGRFSWGVNDGRNDELAYGLDVTASPAWNSAGTAVVGSGEREYAITRLVDGSCQNHYDTTTGRIHGSTTSHYRHGTAFNDNRWWGAKHADLRQWTREYRVCGPADRFTKNRLFRAVVALPACLDTGGKSCKFPGELSRFRAAHLEQRVYAAYGHNRTTTRWEFGCGPSFGVGPTGAAGVSYGCGWSPQADESKVWEIPIMTTLGAGSVTHGPDAPWPHGRP